MSEKQADDWFGQKENIQPRRKGQSSDYLAGLAKQNDPEFQARVKKEQDEWENKVRYEAPENPMIWYDYYTWANKNVFNSYQLKILQHKALNGIIRSENSLERFGKNEKVFELFTKAVDEAKNWEEIMSFVRSKKFFVNLAKFWTIWAGRHEIEEGVREADEILTEGEKYLAAEKEELAKLRKWRGNMDIRVALGRSRQRASDLEGENRDARNQRPRQTRKFGTMIKRDDDPQGEKPSCQKMNSKRTISIFKDSASPTTVAGLEGDWNRAKVPPNIKIKGKENKTKAQKWNKTGGLQGIEAHVPKASTLIIPKDEDDSDEDQITKPKAGAKGQGQLREIRGKTLNQFWSFEDEKAKENGKQKFMYRKNEIYMGLKEVSFEELRAFKYFRSLEKAAAKEEALKNIHTPVQRKLDEDEMLKRSQPSPESDLHDFTPVKLQFTESNLDDLGCGSIPKTPDQIESRDRKLSRISEEASVDFELEKLPDTDDDSEPRLEPVVKKAKKKLAFKIFCDNDDE